MKKGLTFTAPTLIMLILIIVMLAVLLAFPKELKGTLDRTTSFIQVPCIYDGKQVNSDYFYNEILLAQKNGNDAEMAQAYFSAIECFGPWTAPLTNEQYNKIHAQLKEGAEEEKCAVITELKSKWRAVYPASARKARDSCRV